MSEDPKLQELKKSIRERLREGLSRVERLEEATTKEGLEKWMGGEIKRFGGRPVELDDAE